MWAYLLVLKVNLANNRLSLKKVWSILHAHLRMIVQRLHAKNVFLPGDILQHYELWNTERISKIWVKNARA